MPAGRALSLVPMRARVDGVVGRARIVNQVELSEAERPAIECCKGIAKGRFVEKINTVI